MTTEKINQLQKTGMVCVFAKTPKYGQVKTRLEPNIGKKACLDLHKWLVADRLKAFNGLEPVEAAYDVVFYVTDDVEDDFWVEANSIYSIPVHLQRGNTLGDRMWDAVESTLQDKEWVILIGADCPDLDADYIQAAISAMQEDHSAVIGPAEDGGYVLLGLTQPIKDIFYGIDWGSGQVLTQTLEVLDKLGISHRQLPSLRDLDIFDDFLFYQSKYLKLMNINAKAMH